MEGGFLGWDGPCLSRGRRLQPMDLRANWRKMFRDEIRVEKLMSYLHII
jgi:hypothetical protein